jgi:acyl-coenzyme A synthetase/AMP-(fatty) acid ligase
VHQRDLSTEFPGPQRVVDVLARGTAAFGDRLFLVTPTARLTYADADRESRALAKRLVAAGIGKGTRIAVHLPHGPEWIVCFFAATRIGALFMPFSAACKPAELRKALRLGDVHLLCGSTESWHGGPYSSFVEEAIPELHGSKLPVRSPAVPLLREIWLFGDGKLPEWARSVRLGDENSEIDDELFEAIEASVVPADDALVIWTSGTTADPKGAIHSQATIARRAKANAASHAFVAEDRIFCDYAFWWIGGPGYGFLPALWVGATILAVPKHARTSTESFLTRERPTRVAGRLARDIAERVMIPDEGSGHMVSPLGIGMTETFGPHSMFEPEPLADVIARPKSGLGQAILHFERKIIDPDTGSQVGDGEEGELLVRGPGMMRGLYGRERDEVFDSDGWYHTGDKCVLRAGIIHFVSRFTEMIKTSGSNVAPVEVELALLAMPEVQEPVVFGMPDDERGEQVVAVVVPARGAELEEAAVQEWVRSQLSNYKVPRHVFLLDEEDLPRMHSGKPDKAAVREMVAARLVSADPLVAPSSVLDRRAATWSFATPRGR